MGFYIYFISKRCGNIKNCEPGILSSSSTMDIATYTTEDIEIQEIESTEMDVLNSDNNTEVQENYELVRVLSYTNYY